MTLLFKVREEGVGCLSEGWGGGHLFDIVAKGMGTYTRKYSIPVSEVVIKQLMKDFNLLFT